MTQSFIHSFVHYAQQEQKENSIQFSWVSLSCPTLWKPMDHSTPGIPVHHQLLEFTQTRVHWGSDAIQPSHPLLSLSLPAFNLSHLRVFSNESVLCIQFSRSVANDSLRPHESQHARPPCPSPTPGTHSDSRPSSPWCHPAISSSVIPFSSCP